ncbi:putative esterase [Penicillium brevicompactum]|uniref:esterase n=1 Tax=Penicillium brevicompactum TaxID=5074 RepID=UPI0025404B01|nr:esterase [Penicillium brevicompactum]KAJ5325898.1 esterase [Penicillium brevicompactum]
MESQWSFELTDSFVKNTATWQAVNKEDEKYLIQISWPLEWSSTGEPPVGEDRANAIYLTDGNAVFLSATDIVRRRQVRHPEGTPTIIIGISYPLTDSVYSHRRSYDLTPPCETYVSPNSSNGGSQTPQYGGADAFLHFITHTVHHLVFSSIFPQLTIRETAVFGHSFGALFVLHALYTAPSSFDTYLAASPSIWWNESFILREEESYYQTSEDHHRPKVWLAYGSLEQSPVLQRNQSEAEYEKRLAVAKERLMGDNCDHMFVRLMQSGQLRSVIRRKYEDEDHGSVIAAALSGAIYYFLDQSEEE